MQKLLEPISLGVYPYEEKEYHLYYVGTEITHPTLLVTDAEGNALDSGIPEKESYEAYPEHPLSVAYTRAQEKGFRLSRLYRTEEAATLLTKQINQLRKDVRQEIANRGIELELPRRVIRPSSIRRHLKLSGGKGKKKYVPIVVSGDYYIDQETYDHLYSYYAEGYKKAAYKQERQIFKEMYVPLGSLAETPEVPVSRQQLYNLVQQGLIEVKDDGKRYYANKETVARVKEMYRIKAKPSTVPN